MLPFWSLGAGPRQALLEAIVHRNHGCTHFLVSPQQADPLVENGGEPFYPAGAAQRLVAEFAEETGIAMSGAGSSIGLTIISKAMPSRDNNSRRRGEDEANTMGRVA